MNKAIVIIPAYNEEKSIRNIVDAIRALDNAYDILVVDDGSIDDTSEIAKSAGAIAVRHLFNLGYGSALQTGYKYALKKGYDRAVQIDGDGQHDPAYIPALLRMINSSEADLVLGSRFITENGYKATFIRRTGMKIFSFLATVMMKQRITDSTSGYQALNMKVLQFYADERYPADFPDADTLIMLKRSGFKIEEIPVKMFGSARKSMHSGIRPVYYIFKMILSIILTMVRKEKKNA